MKIYIEDQSHKTALGDWTKTERLPFVYAHGRLEKMAGFDLLNISKGEKFDRTPRTENVTAVLPDGKEVPAQMYFWVGPNDINRGLVVKNDDYQAEVYAKEKFSKRADFL